MAGCSEVLLPTTQTVLHCITLYCTILYYTTLYFNTLYCIVSSLLICTVLLYILLLCNQLICTVLYCTALQCTVLYCTVLYSNELICTVHKIKSLTVPSAQPPGWIGLIPHLGRSNVFYPEVPSMAQCSTNTYRSVQFSKVKYSSVQCSAVQYTSEKLSALCRPDVSSMTSPSRQLTSPGLHWANLNLNMTLNNNLKFS